MLKTGAVCVCGHEDFEHAGGEKCEACVCTGFGIKPVKPHVCTECGEASAHEICPVCAKWITDNSPGDLLDYLFGITGDDPTSIKRVKAKRLALDMRTAGVNVRQLWEHYNT